MESTIPEVKQKKVTCYDDLAPEPSWSFGEFKPSQTSKWTHGYHRYPAKFIPQLVEKLFDEYLDGPDCHVNDPFMGSGTTIVSAMSRGYVASGTDINAVAELIVRVKATPLDPGFLQERMEALFSRLAYVGLEKEDLVQDYTVPLIPKTHEARIDYWFLPDVKTVLGCILRHIYGEMNLEVRSFFLVAFSHILKNCSVWMQESTKPTRDFKKRRVCPVEAIDRHLRKMSRGNEEFWKVAPDLVKKNLDSHLRICRGDARSQPVEDHCVDLIVSSSPYVTSYEYADLHQLSTIWLDLVGDLDSYKRGFIGTARKRSQQPLLTGPLALQTVEHIREHDVALSRQIQAFFLDMESVFRESHRILKPGARCCYVIGNTKLKGVPIRNAEIFAESMGEVGFSVERVIKREIPNKILPQTRNEKTGRFARRALSDSEAYPVEFIIVGRKD